jgi:hypothetical protein
MTDQALEKRAGNNIGVVTSLYPRIRSGKTRFVALPKGPSDTELWTCPDDVETLIISSIDFFNNVAVPSPLSVQLVLKSPAIAGGLEHPAVSVNVPALAAGVTGTITVSPFDVPLTLTPGEKLLLRIADPTYLGGCVVEASAGVIYGQGGFSVRKTIDTNLTKIVAPPPGKGLGAINAGINYANNLLFPIWLLNSDSVPHTVNFYLEENGVDTLVIQNWPVLASPNGFIGVPYNSVASDQVLKAQINEPIVTPGKNVLAAVFYMVVDEPAEDLG